VDIVASEVCKATDRAVERWMAEIDSALVDPKLTSLGRLHAVGEIVARYKFLTGKTTLSISQPSA
jgi:hypothetical protein